MEAVMNTHWHALAAQISAAVGQNFVVAKANPLSGGCINQTYVLQGCGQHYCVKLNSLACEAMFAAEAEGLQALAASNSIAVPQPICWGVAGHQAFLVMTYFRSGGNREAAALLGEQLAQMHRCSQKQFGWRRDNYLGSSPQPNDYRANWLDFWREQRLGFQLQLAARHGFGEALQSQGERLLQKLDAFFVDYQPVPSLLHGDLWSGNYAVQENGQPIIFDPAVYFGDRETDLAMTELFGGFDKEFYAAYQASWALDTGYRVRKNLYNLYHILNHANLFGGGYVGQAQRMIDALLSEVI